MQVQGLTANRTLRKSRTFKPLILPLNFTLDVDNSTSTDLNKFFLEPRGNWCTKSTRRTIFEVTC
jgi:hypothetical protein